jgi:hypothetical protein
LLGSFATFTIRPITPFAFAGCRLVTFALFIVGRRCTLRH